MDEETVTDSQHDTEKHTHIHDEQSNVGTRGPAEQGGAERALFYLGFGLFCAGFAYRHIDEASHALLIDSRERIEVQQSLKRITAMVRRHARYININKYSSTGLGWVAG